MVTYLKFLNSNPQPTFGKLKLYLDPRCPSLLGSDLISILLAGLVGNKRVYYIIRDYIGLYSFIPYNQQILGYISPKKR